MHGIIGRTLSLKVPVPAWLHFHNSCYKTCFHQSGPPNCEALHSPEIPPFILHALGIKIVTYWYLFVIHGLDCLSRLLSNFDPPSIYWYPLGTITALDALKPGMRPRIVHFNDFCATTKSDEPHMADIQPTMSIMPWDVIDTIKSFMRDRGDLLRGLILNHDPRAGDVLSYIPCFSFPDRPLSNLSLNTHRGGACRIHPDRSWAHEPPVCPKRFRYNQRSSLQAGPSRAFCCRIWYGWKHPTGLSGHHSWSGKTAWILGILYRRGGQGESVSSFMICWLLYLIH